MRRLLLVLLLLSAVMAEPLFVNPEEITGDANRGRVASNTLHFSNGGGAMIEVALETSLDTVTIPSGFVLRRGEERDVIVRSFIPMFLESATFEDEVKVYVNGDLDQTVPVSLAVGEAIFEVEIEEHEIWIVEVIVLVITSRTPFFAVSDKGGLLVGMLLIVVLVIIGLYYVTEKKYEYTVLCGLLIVVLFFVMGGNVI